MKFAKKLIAMFLLLVICVSSFPVSAFGSDSNNSEKKIVRVGYLPNYATIVEPARFGKMGYGYDYLEEIAKYTNWEYEFIPCEWSDGLDMLEKGEIDIFGPMQKTDERIEKFDFPTREMGYECAALYSLEGSGIFYEDFEHFNNMTVAVDKASFFGSLIEPFCQKNNIKLNVVHAPGTAYLEGLKEKKFDLAFVGSLLTLPETNVVAKVTTHPFYYTTTKGNTEVLNGLNSALDIIFSKDIYFASKLEKKYFSDNPINSVAITREENTFIEEHPTLTVVSDPSFSPVSSYNDITNEYTGVSVDVLKKIGEFCGVKFEFVKTKNRNESIDMLNDGQADLMLDGFNNSDLNIIYSDSILDMPMVLLGTNYADSAKELTVAMPDLSSEASTLLMENYPNYRYINYKSFDKVKEAVKSKSVDLGFIGSYMVDDLAREDNFRDYQVVSTNINYPIKIAIPQKANPAILGLVNKSVLKLTNEQINSIVFENTVNRVYQIPFIRVLQDNILLVILILFLFFAAMLIFIFISSRNTKIKLQKAAYVDYLTGLYTKEKFRIEAESKLKNAQKDEYCIFSIDINNFKYINDAFGYTIGNRVLQAIGDHLREHDELYLIAARTQADTFVVFAKTPPKDLIIPTVQALHDAHSHISEVLPNHYHVTFSTGVYIIDKPSLSLDAMIDKAGTARKSVKGGYQSSISIYTNIIEEVIDRQKDITLAMEHALYNNEFLVYLQPKFDLQENTIVGAEALVRWENPSRGFMMPDDFISLFEKNGFIIKLDLYMFKQVSLIVRNIMNRYNSENKTHDEDFNMIFSVNLSKFSLTDPFIVEKICELLHQSQVPTRLIEIELTESLVTDDLENLLKIMERFRSKGFTVSIDDFGSGYSSLNLLKDLPVQIIKIDRAFLSQSSDTYRGQTIISSILHMAKLLGICTVAEGVENEEQVHLLRSMGCNIAQGYYYSKPLPKDEFIEKFVFPAKKPVDNQYTAD